MTDWEVKNIVNGRMNMSLGINGIGAGCGSGSQATLTRRFRLSECIVFGQLLLSPWDLPLAVIILSNV